MRTSTWQHKIERRSRAQFEDLIASIDWVADSIRNDYGEDYLVRPFTDEQPTGTAFFVQIKGTKQLEKYGLKEQNTLSYPLPVKKLVMHP